MYRDGKTYDEIDKVIIDIFRDYNLKSFPLDEIDICNRMGVALVPYSEFGRIGMRLLRKRTPHGFFVKESEEQSPTIYYNDCCESKGSIRFTIFHELKHYVYDDKSDDKDDLADYFARHMMCPTPYIMLKCLDSPNEIVSYCGVSVEAAENAYRSIVNRRRKYGMNLFDYEVPLIEHLEPVLLETFQGEIIKTTNE